MASGFTQADIADKIGVSCQIYRRVETGTGQLSHSGLVDFCRVIGIDPGALLREAGYTAFKEEIERR
jgi:transcriptional regulator with XRE-family HTH domain